MKNKVRRFNEIRRRMGVAEAMRGVSRYIQNEVLQPTIASLYQPVFEHKYGDGIAVMEQDWDNLILLDACRWDIFRDHTSFTGKLSREVSKGNYSWEFMEENFVGQHHHDTVYVTANPFAERLSQDVFYTIESVLPKWSEQHETVLPEDVTETAINAREKYPDKRLLIHYMQPHAPFLGNFASSLDVDVGGWGESNDELETDETKQTIWSLYQDGKISREQLTDGYIQNLKIVEEAARPLVDMIDGKTVITSDHGENLGETFLSMEYLSHANETKNCRFVPWLELPFEERRSVTEEDPIGYQSLEDSLVHERLEDLGYM